MEALGIGEKVAWDFFREGWVEELRQTISWVGGGGSYNSGKSKKNECCFNEAGHGQVTIILR